jgi:hypothetical protein
MRLHPPAKPGTRMPKAEATAMAAVFLRVKISPESTGQTSRLSAHQSGQKDGQDHQGFSAVS